MATATADQQVGVTQLDRYTAASADEGHAGETLVDACRRNVANCVLRCDLERRRANLGERFSVARVFLKHNLPSLMMLILMAVAVVYVLGVAMSAVFESESQAERAPKREGTLKSAANNSKSPEVNPKPFTCMLGTDEDVDKFVYANRVWRYKQGDEIDLKNLSLHEAISRASGENGESYLRTISAVVYSQDDVRVRLDGAAAVCAGMVSEKKLTPKGLALSEL